MKIYEDEKNIHEGHRRRLMQQVYESDFEKMTKYQQVESLMTYIIPRYDVNPLAHRLLSRFGSFSGILDAPFEELCKIHGMREDSARKLKNFKKLFERYTKSKLEDAIKLNTLGKLYDSLFIMFMNKDIEEVHLFAFNNSEECYKMEKIAEGDNAHVNFDITKLFKFCTDYKAASVLVVHNHPGGRCNPSNGDLTTYKAVAAGAEVLQVKIMENLIIGVDGIYSLVSNTRVKDYKNIDIDSLVNMFTKDEDFKPQE